MFKRFTRRRINWFKIYKEKDHLVQDIQGEGSRFKIYKEKDQSLRYTWRRINWFKI